MNTGPGFIAILITATILFVGWMQRYGRHIDDASGLATLTFGGFAFALIVMLFLFLELIGPLMRRRK